MEFQMAASPNSSDARRASRRRTDAPSTLRAKATGPIDTIVHDVSATGARIQCEAELAIGDAVSIGLTGVGAVRAIVVWNREDFYGLDFMTPLAAADADHAFTGETVISLGGPVAPEEAEVDQEGEGAGLYGEGIGMLATLLLIVAAVTGGIVAWLQGWI
jgi:hypothetical protein